MNGTADGLHPPDGTGISMGDVLAELGKLALAGRLHGELEVNVLREAHLLIKQSCTAHRAELVALVHEAADNTSRALQVSIASKSPSSPG